MSRSRILLFGYRPPPYFGPSITYEALLHSEFPEKFDVTFVDISVAETIRDIERIRPRKLLRLLSFAGAELWHLLRQRYDFCCVPVSTNRNAFLKEALLLRLAQTFGVPTVLYAHGNGFVDFHARSSRGVQRLIQRTISRCAAAIVMGERLRSNFSPWLPADRIFVVGSGIEPSPIPARTERAGRPATVLYLGNLIREKGVLVLLEAIARLSPVRPALRFVFAGGWWREEDQRAAETFISQRSLAGCIEFAGVVWGENKWQRLAAADVLALPTHFPYEAHPLVLLEALEAGVPVVTTARGAIPEIIVDGVNGLLVREEDPADLAEKLLRLIDDPKLRARMAEASRQRFAEQYTHVHYGRRMIAVFEALAGHAL